MQTVQFQCGHCGKLMAVGSEHLGEQVRCPHCQQVVIAPPPAAPASAPNPVDAPPPGGAETAPYTPAPASDAEDIFSPADGGDDLFGGGEAPRVEIPAEPLAPPLPGDNAVAPPPAEATLSSTMPFVPPPEPVESPPSPAALFEASATPTVPPPEGAAPWTSAPVTETPAPSAPEPQALAAESSARLTRARERAEVKVPWFMLLVFIPLLLYAVVITIFAALLYVKEQDFERQLRRRFEIMPDEGDKPGVQKGKQISLWKYDPKLPTLPLPDHLCTTLGKPLRIGDLGVTPDRVERKRVKVIVETYRPEPCEDDSLVLYLRMKNLSSEYAFAPLDNYFDRRWQGGARPPFTLLEVNGKYRFHGGPADWYPRGDANHRRQWVEGRHNLPEVLQPADEKELFVCTNGYDEKETAVLFGGAGRARPHSFLWRVRVRRGLVRFEDKDYSTTAVIGVRFTDKDIADASPPAQ